ncbi:uncharacterized protein CDV56_107613 [Aspergillus thermomutatus]|uniref:Uncharacterized protein n=1 Tax=Aspergillus thermomutatus TaxID=41047 RepID=A0A397I1F9_ASPTH|nr:uncharacterized protein CDV56_107613 [Aspergillus thermomutatus]RHZ67143.1 hypothetical protein CDV56_107613 [Aspergillus thermomutatus]
MADSVSTDLNTSHSTIGFLFRKPKRWTQEHLDSLRIQEHENTSVSEIVGKTNLPTNNDPAYRLLTLQIALPSKEDILTKAESDDWFPANAFTYVFDSIHKLAQTPEDKTPPADLFGGIVSVMALLYRFHNPEARNIWDLSHGFPFHFQTCRVRGVLKCNGALGWAVDGGSTVATDTPFHSLIIYNTVTKPEAENAMKCEIPFGLFLAFAAFDRNPTRDEYVSFVFNLRRTAVQVTKIVATRSYLRALCEGREVSEHLHIYRSAEYDLVEPDGRKEFLTLFLGVMKHSLTQFSDVSKSYPRTYRFARFFSPSSSSPTSPTVLPLTPIPEIDVSNTWNMSSNKSVILKSLRDWDTWNKQFRAEGERKDLLDLVDGLENFRTRPKTPDPANYHSQPHNTRNSTQASILIFDDPIAELSNEERSAYQLAYTIYKDRRDLYDKQRALLDKLQTWMTKSVASSYSKTCFHHKRTIKEWYDALKEQVGVDEYDIKREIVDAYKRAVKPLSKTPKDFESWITNWEQIMAEGTERDLYFATSINVWFEDFITAAVNPIDPTWTKAYQLTNRKEVREGSLSYRTLANDFRDVVRTLSTSARFTRIAKGSFGTTFAGQGTGDESDDSSTNSTAKVIPEKKKKTGKQNRKRGHSRTISLATATGRCRACNQGHDLHACYYIFPGKAPDWFRPRSDIKERVEEKLRKDDSLAEEINWLKKSMDIRQEGHQP